MTWIDQRTRTRERDAGRQDEAVPAQAPPVLALQHAAGEIYEAIKGKRITDVSHQRPFGEQ